MKRFTEYTQDELALLDEEGVQRLIDIEIAVAGIAPVSPPLPLNPERLGLVKSETAYRVSGTLYETMEDAKIAQGLKMVNEDYDCAAGWHYKYLVPVNGPGIDMVQFYQKSDVLENAGRLRDLNNEKEKYDKEQATYKEYLKAIGVCRDEVKDAVNEAHIRAPSPFQSAQQTLDNYVKLAEGDEAIAKNFFLGTYKNQPDIIEAVLGLAAGLGAGRGGSGVSR